MRPIHSLLLAGLFLFAAGCSAQTNAAPIAPDAHGSAERSLIAPAQPGLDPVQTAKALTEGRGDLRWLKPPTAYVVQQLTYGDAHKLIPMLSAEGDQFWGSQTAVWLVAFRGRWASVDSGQANYQPVTYDGCTFVLFRAADGALIATGDTTCPGKG